MYQHSALIFLALHAKLSISRDVTYQISRVDNMAKLALLSTSISVTLMKNHELQNNLFAFPHGCSLCILVIFTLITTHSSVGHDKVQGKGDAHWEMFTWEL